MARAGILYSHVAQAAAKLVGDDKNPTVDKVREAMGSTGSKSTIAPLLKRWKAEHQDAVVGCEVGLPAELLQAIKSVYDKMEADTRQKLEQAREEHLRELEGAADQVAQGETASRLLTATNAALSTELTQVREALAQLQAAHHAQSVALATAQAAGAGLQHRLADRAAEVAALIQQLTQARAQFEHYQEATAAQREQDRQTTEQRIARLEQDLAGAQQRVLIQQTTLAQDEVQMEHLLTENTSMRETLRSSQEALKSEQLESDQLSHLVKEFTAASHALNKKLDAAEQTVMEARMALAAKEKQTELLTERLGHIEAKAEKLDQERIALIQERAELQAQVATDKRRDKV